MSVAPQQMLVIKLSSLGDIVHALPAATMIRSALGFAMDWVTQPEYAELVSKFEGVRRVITFPRHAIGSRGAAFARALRATSYDLILDFQGLMKSALVTRLARGRVRIGPSYAREGARFFYDEVAGTLDKNRHAVDEALDFVRTLGLPRGDVCFPINIPRGKLDGTRPYIGIVPCSRWGTKNWPMVRFVEAAALLRRFFSATFFILGSQLDARASETLVQGIGEGVVNLCGKTSLVELAAVLQDLDLLLTVDSGPMHIATAFGVPVVAVFGATDPVRTGPYGVAHRLLVQEDLPCRPCFSEKCARRDLACLYRISAERVAHTAIEMLARQGEVASKS